jgi:hypothetical protein
MDGYSHAVLQPKEVTFFLLLIPPVMVTPVQYEWSHHEKLRMHDGMTL